MRASVPDQSKTSGFRSRIILVPERVRKIFGTKTAGILADKQIKYIRIFNDALREALALASAGGSWEELNADRKRKQKKHFPRSKDGCAWFDHAADSIFFPALWEQVAAEGAGELESRDRAERDFIRDLHGHARHELEAALPAIPCAAIHRPRAEARARRAFAARLRREPGFLFLFEKEAADELVPA